MTGGFALTSSENTIETCRVAIILPTYNGATYLGALLDSIGDQTSSAWHLLASDDGSSDTSKEILQAFKAQYPEQVSLFDGPQNGITANYLSLINRVDSNTAITAFCDQDDIWLDTRLSRIIEALGDEQTPTLYCGRTQLIDAQGKQLRLSPARLRPPSFENALCQNIASGNTMAFNTTALRMLQRNSSTAQDIPFHDWWAYQLITGAAGRVVHDVIPTLLYRQHSANAVGAATGFRGALRRVGRVAVRDLSTDVDLHLAALEAADDILTPQNARLVGKLQQSRRSGPLSRLFGTLKGGLYRQTRAGTLGLWASALLGRF